MSKRILAAAMAAAALSLAGCDRAEHNEAATENIEELNATEDLNMDMNADLNMDMNATNVNATDNATGNGSADNATNSY